MVQKQYYSHITDTTNIRWKFLSKNICQYNITLTAETQSQLYNVSQNDQDLVHTTQQKTRSKPPLLFHKLFNTAST